MTLATLLAKPCTITTRLDTGTTGAYGDILQDDAQVHTVCELQQQQRTESPDGTVSASTWLLFLPSGTVIGQGAAVTVDDEDYEVIGEPWDARTGHVSMWHVEATVRRASGSTDEHGS